MNGTLARSRTSMIGGVAAGVAEWVNADPALVRIAWAILVPITSGVALLAYLVAWAVIPEAPAPSAADGVATEPASPTKPSQPFDEGRVAWLIGGGLILVGLWFLVRQYLPAIDWSLVWPLILVAAGVVVLVGASRRR